MIEINAIIKNFSTISTTKDIRKLIRGETIAGQLDFLLGLITEFRNQTPQSQRSEAIVGDLPTINPIPDTSESTISSALPLRLDNDGKKKRSKQKPEASAEKKRLKEARQVKQQLEKEAKEKRAMWQAQNMAAVKEAYRKL